MLQGAAGGAARQQRRHTKVRQLAVPRQAHRVQACTLLLLQLLLLHLLQLLLLVLEAERGQVCCHGLPHSSRHHT